jgi:hypothetical protein
VAATVHAEHPPAEPPLVDSAEIRSAMEYYARQNWTDGLPVVPVT